MSKLNEEILPMSKAEFMNFLVTGQLPDGSKVNTERAESNSVIAKEFAQRHPEVGTLIAVASAAVATALELAKSQGRSVRETSAMLVGVLTEVYVLGFSLAMGAVEQGELIPPGQPIADLLDKPETVPEAAPTAPSPTRAIEVTTRLTDDSVITPGEKLRALVNVHGFIGGELVKGELYTATQHPQIPDSVMLDEMPYSMAAPKGGSQPIEWMKSNFERA